MSFGTSEAAVYDVKYQVNVGQFEADNKSVADIYSSTTGSMSDQALRAAVAQEKLDRAIKLHGPSSLAAKTATLAYRKEMAALGDQAELTGAELEGSGRRAAAAGAGFRTAETEVSRLGRGMLSGSGLMTGFGRAAAFASTAFLGGAGLVFAIRSVLEASQKEEVALGLTKNALRDTGLSWGQYGGQITGSLDALERHTAFTKEDLLTTFGNLVRRTGDVNQSLALTGTAANLARGRNIDLASAGNILIKALNGQTSALTRMGIQVTKVTSAQDALHASGVKATAEQLAAAKAADSQATREAVLASVKAKYGQAAATYLQTEAGKQALLNAQLKDSEAIIGHALEPAIAKLLDTGARRLEQMNKDGSLQRDVNRAVQDGTQVVHGLTDAFHLLEPPIAAVVDALGGIAHAVELGLVLALIAKARSAAAALGLITGASIKARTQIVADATVEDAALAGVAAQASETAGAVTAAGAAGAGAAGAAGGAAAAGAEGAGLAATAGAAGVGIAALLKKGGKLLTRGGEIYIVYKGLQFALNPAPATDSGPNRYGGSLSHGWGNLISDVAHGHLGRVATDIGEGLANDAALTNYKSGSAKAGPLSGLEALIALRDNPLSALKALIALRNNANAVGQGEAGSYGPSVSTTTNPPPATTGLSFKVQQQLLDAQISGSQSAQLAADQAAAAELEQKLSQPGLTHADILTIKGQLAQYTGDATSIEQAMQQTQASAAAKANAAKAAGQRRYATGVSTRASGLRDDVTKALKLEQHQIRTTRGPGGKIIAAGPGFVEPDAEKTLTAYYKQEAGDLKLTGAEQARYHTLYINELAKVATERDQFDAKVTKIIDEARTKQAARLKTQRETRDQLLQNRLAEAQLAETEAGTNATKVKKAQEGEIAAELAILKQQQAEGAKLTGLAKQQNIAEQLATKTAIAQLKNGLNPATAAAAGSNEAQFLSSFSQIVQSYAPNAFTGGKAETHLFNVVHENRAQTQLLKRISTQLATDPRGAEVAIQAAFG